MKKIPTLERVQFVDPSAIDMTPRYGDVPETAAELLGYTALKSAERSNRLMREQQKELAEAFAKTGIRPFTQESVKHYKEALVGTWHNQIDRWWVLASLGVAAFVAIAVVTWLASWNEGPTLAWIGLGAVILVAATMILVLGMGGVAHAKIPRWEERIIGQYGPQIPQPVVLDTIALAEALPHALFVVYELQAGKRRGPFVIEVRHKGEYEISSYADREKNRWVIAQWNEASFTAASHE